MSFAVTRKTSFPFRGRKAIMAASWPLALLALFSCTTATRIRIPDSKRWEYASGRIHIATDEGEEATDSLRVRNDTAYYGGRSVPVRAIRKIERRTLSAPRTLGLAACGLAATSLAIGIALSLAVAYDRGPR
jgi:hypothetical protein